MIILWHPYIYQCLNQPPPSPILHLLMHFFLVSDQGLGPRLTTTGNNIGIFRKNELWLPVKPPRCVRKLYVYTCVYMCIRVYHKYTCIRANMFAHVCVLSVCLCISTFSVCVFVCVYSQRGVWRGNWG